MSGDALFDMPAELAPRTPAADGDGALFERGSNDDELRCIRCDGRIALGNSSTHYCYVCLAELGQVASDRSALLRDDAGMRPVLAALDAKATR